MRYFVGDPAEIRWALQALGCTSELDERDKLIAINVPATASLKDVRALLAQGVEDGRWVYDEPIIRRR